MQYEVSRHYISLCETYGWQATLVGLAEFEKLVQSGRFAKWTGPRGSKRPRFKWQEGVQQT